MKTRRIKYITIRLVLLVFILSVVIPHPASAVTEEQYRNAQDILWQVPCDQTPTAQQATEGQPAPAPTSGGGGGGDCGDQGYASGAGTSQRNKQLIWNYLKGKGLSDNAAAGIMGNMDKETGGTFLPDAINPINCRGIVQWCFGRMDDGTENSLMGYAATHGGNWACLQTQLDFMWHEMTNTAESQVMGPLQGSTSAGQAANTFHDIYERSNTATGEHLGRAERAERIYSEFTGKDAGPAASPASEQQAPNTVNDPNSCVGSVKQQSAGAQTGDSNQAYGQLPLSTCEAAFNVKRLINSGKIDIYESDTNKPYIEKDLNHCTTDQISCGTGDGQPGGANPKILRAIAAAAQNSGANKLTMWNLNTGHGCDGLNHPNGKASDIYCIGNESGATTASEDCNKIFKYLYDNYDALELEELIWQYPPAGYSCSDPKILCDIAGHQNHIHVGVR